MVESGHEVECFQIGEDEEVPLEREKHPRAHDKGYVEADYRAYLMISRKTPNWRGKKSNQGSLASTKRHILKANVKEATSR